MLLLWVCVFRLELVSRVVRVFFRVYLLFSVWLCCVVVCFGLKVISMLVWWFRWFNVCFSGLVGRW